MRHVCQECEGTGYAPEKPLNEFKFEGITFKMQQARIVSLLARNQGREIPYERICREIYHDREVRWPNRSLRVVMTNTRKKLKGTGWRIVNNWGIGYRLVRSDQCNSTSKNSTASVLPFVSKLKNTG